jgi:hypothetical protein
VIAGSDTCIIYIHSAKVKMSKAKYTVKKGLAQIITTGEPVFVKGFTTKEFPLTQATSETREYAIVTRPVVTQNGIEYREEEFPLDQLETRFEQAKRTVEFESFVQDLREEATNKRYVLSADSKAALKANAQPKFTGNGDING